MSKEYEKLNMRYLEYLTNFGKYTDPEELLALQLDILISSKSVKKICINTIVMLLRCVKTSFNTLKKMSFLTFFGEWSRLSDNH